MKRGFVLTESEKNRIKKIYNRGPLMEATSPIPTDTDEIKKFEDWMDEKHPNWVTLTTNGKMGNSKKSDGTPRSMYGSANSPSFQRAWEKWGDDYVKETGGTPGSPTYDEFGYYDKAAKKFVGPKTKDEMEALKLSGTITDDTWVVGRQKNGKWSDYSKAKDSGFLDFGPGLPPDTEIQIPGQDQSSGKVTPVNPVGGTIEEPKTVSSTDQTFGVGGTIKRPGAQVDPFAAGAGGTNEFSTTGFSNWYNSIYGKQPPAEAVIDDKTKTATVTVGDKQMKFLYNQVLKDWNLPSSATPGTTIIKPVDDKAVPKK